MKKLVHRGKLTTLKDNEYLASGGEAEVYLHNGLVFKVYTRPVPPDLAEKLQELQVLDHPSIIRPLDLVYSDITGEPLGYTMAYVDEGVGLPLLFTSSYQMRNSISLLKVQELVQKMADITAFIHSKRCLAVDGNEYNWIVDRTTHSKPVTIDVDSFQTPKHKASVIMPSIRDYTSATFTELTDWYSLGTITFQLFTGIHPYKGKHPTLKTIEDRCKANVSVFNKDVSFPASVRDFGIIPPAYKQWYEDIFEKGQRTPPPAMSLAVQIRMAKKMVTAAFNITKVFSTANGENIQHVEWLFGKQVVTTEYHINIAGHDYARVNPKSVVIITDEGRFFEAYYDKDGLVLADILTKGTYVDKTKKADRWFSIDGRLYAIYEQNLSEMNVRSVNGTPNAFFNTTQQIAAQSTKVFSGTLYADVLGNAVFYTPFEAKKISVVSVPELNKHRIIDAKYQKGLLIVAAVDPKGNPKIFTFDGGYKSVALVEDTDLQEVNSVVLSNGVTIRANATDDSLTLFAAGDFKGARKIVTDAGLPSGAILVNNGQQAHYFVDDSLYLFSMK